jgi:hypothetical protein
MSRTNLFRDKAREAELLDPYYVPYDHMRCSLGIGLVHGRIIRIFDDRNMLVDVEIPCYGTFDHEDCWLSGDPTTDYVDGQKVRVLGCYQLSGRKQFGGQTVHLLTPFNIQEYLIKK